MKALHNQCRNNDHVEPVDVETKSTNKYGWNVLIDKNTHIGLEILCEHFELSKKLVIRQLVSEKITDLKLKNPIKEVTLRQ
jgi:hypothetical protein